MEQLLSMFFFAFHLLSVINTLGVPVFMGITAYDRYYDRLTDMADKWRETDILAPFLRVLTTKKPQKMIISAVKTLKIKCKT